MRGGAKRRRAQKQPRPREPAGTFGQQTFIDLAEVRDCAHGAFIVIRSGMPGMRNRCDPGSEIYGGFW
jgi:hypothetical protein